LDGQFSKEELQMPNKYMKNVQYTYLYMNCKYSLRILPSPQDKLVIIKTTITTNVGNDEGKRKPDTLLVEL
jgi:hypothetical protein